MKNNTRISVLILFFFACFGRLWAQQDLLFSRVQPTISMDFQDARLKDILKIFSIQSGLNFIASEAVQDRQVTLYMDNVPIQEAMDKIFKANNLSYDLDEETSIFIVKDWGKPEIETITKVFTLKYRSVPSSKLETEKNTLMATSPADGADIVFSLRQVISANGKISEDPKTNSLVITDIPSHFPQIEKVIASLDVPQPQVMLDVEVLDVSKNVVDKLGFDFGKNPFTLQLPGEWLKRGSQYYFGASAEWGKEGSVTLGHSYTKALDFLRTQTDTKYLARPRLLTLSNEVAEISVTKDEVVGYEQTTETTSSGTTTDLKYIRSTDLALTKEGVGIYLRVTPQVNMETNEITLVINPKSSVTSTSALADSQADAEVRTTKSIVKIRDGETIVLGGLIHTDKQVAESKLPILGDIPILGILFRHKNKTKDTDRELIVFITPRIIRDTNSGAAYAKKTVLPDREQSVSSATDRQLTIKKSLDTFEKED